jgi:phosphoribosylaminoimidazole carboxylase PurE protein
MVKERKTDSEQKKLPDQKIVIIMGSEKDEDHCKKITSVLDQFGVGYEVRIGSAHKTPEYLTEMLSEYNKQTDFQLVFIAVAGRSNALGGFVDFQTTAPVISSPPYSEAYGGIDIFSSLRMPSGIAAVTATEPQMAALHAIKILCTSNPELRDKYQAYQKELQEDIIKRDQSLHLQSNQIPK